jgi:hypothetical protein
VDSLQEEFGFTIGERATKNRDLLYTVTRQDTYTALGKAITGHEQPRIYDRLFFSEMVYAPIAQQRKCEFTEAEQHWVRRVLRAIGCPIIVCYADPEVMQKNALADHQMEGVKEKHSEICKAYKEMFNGHTWVMFYDYTGAYDHLSGYKNYMEIVNGIHHYLETRKEREW